MFVCKNFAHWRSMKKKCHVIAVNDFNALHSYFLAGAVEQGELRE